MGRKMKTDALLSGKEKAWLFLESLPNGDMRPFAGSLALTEEVANRDILLAGCSVPGPLLCVRIPARALVDFCPDIPVYYGSETRG